jgi:hypothetical protein
MKQISDHFTASSFAIYSLFSVCVGFFLCVYAVTSPHSFCFVVNNLAPWVDTTMHLLSPPRPTTPSTPGSGIPSPQPPPPPAAAAAAAAAAADRRSGDPRRPTERLAHVLARQVIKDAAAGAGLSMTTAAAPSPMAPTPSSPLHTRLRATAGDGHISRHYLSGVSVRPETRDLTCLFV